MNSSKKKEIKVGIVTILAILLFITAIALVNQMGISVDYKDISIRFPNSGGIDPSSPVFVNGVKRGKVISITPDNGSVLIKASIDNISDFREDVIAKLLILEITGGKKIEISPGISANKFSGNKEIPGITSPDMGEMVAMLGDMGTDAQSLLKKLDTIATGASNLLNDENGYSKLEQTINNTSEMVAILHSFVKNNIDDLEFTVKNLKKITLDLKYAIDKYEPKADNLFTKLDLTVDETRALIKNADKMIANTDNLIVELTKLKSEIKDSGGIAGKILYDKEFAARIDSTFSTLQQFLFIVKDHGININAEWGHYP